MIYVILPAYNEARSLPGIFDELLRLREVFTVILVNDGSTDGTLACAKTHESRLPLRIINHEQNLGLGSALATGFGALRNTLLESDAVVTLDSDGTHPLGLVPLLKEKIDAGADVAIASRFCPGGGQSGVPLYRTVLSSGERYLLRLCWPLKGVRDYSSGYRMFSGNVVRQLFASCGDRLITERGFSATLELLLKTSRHTERFAEVPLSLHYEDKKGPSKMRVVRTVFRSLAVIAKLRFGNRS